MTLSPARQIDGFLAKYDPKIARLWRAAVAKMRKRLPTAVEMVYDNYNGLVMGFGPSERPREAIFSVVAYPRWIGLCFLWGAKLPDPKKLLIGSGKQVRGMRLTDAKALDDPEVQALITRALDSAPKPLAAGKAKGPRRTIIKSVSAKQRARRPQKAGR